MEPNHSADTLGFILGPIGSHWDQKMGQNHKNDHAPKIRIFYFSAVIDLSKKSNLRLWRQITMGTPRVHLGANGVPLGPKMGQNRKKLPHPKIPIFDFSVVIDLGKISIIRFWRQITMGTP